MNELSPLATKAMTPAALDTPFRWLRSEIDRLFDDFGRPALAAFRSGDEIVPALDLEKTDKGYRLSAELPGLKDEDIEVSVDERVLTISGEKQHEEERHEGGVLMSERRYGKFSRSLRLPDDADPDKVEAHIKKGVLTVTIARDEQFPDRVRRIAVTRE